MISTSWFEHKVKKVLSQTNPLPEKMTFEGHNSVKLFESRNDGIV